MARAFLGESWRLSSKSIRSPLTWQPIPVQDAKAVRGPIQTCKLTEFEGATIVMDVRAVGSIEHPQYQLRLRIESIEHDLFATALHDLIVQDEPEWKRGLNLMTIPEIKAKLQEIGDADEIRGRTRKADLLAALRACLERRQPGTKRVVARAGDEGKVVKPLYKTEDGEYRIGVCFSEGHCTNVLPSQITIGDPVLSNGERRIGQGSQYVLKAAYLAFRKGIFSHEDQTDFLLECGDWKPAVPDVALTGWQSPLPSSSRGSSSSVFKTTESVSCQLEAKLKLECRLTSVDDAEYAEVETPARKRPRFAPA
mmetsp:Transcript_7835/g.17206  ORF Transcript_7835/g.17206 Transcript_7835/m.17206 type:complete len:310 (-) Transcript_7835:24-953(-)